MSSNPTNMSSTAQVDDRFITPAKKQNVTTDDDTSDFDAPPPPASAAHKAAKHAKRDDKRRHAESAEPEEVEEDEEAEEAEEAEDSDSSSADSSDEEVVPSVSAPRASAAKKDAKHVTVKVSKKVTDKVTDKVTKKVTCPWCTELKKGGGKAVLEGQQYVVEGVVDPVGHRVEGCPKRPQPVLDAAQEVKNFTARVHEAKHVREKAAEAIARVARDNLKIKKQSDKEKQEAAVLHDLAKAHPDWERERLFSECSKAWKHLEGQAKRTKTQAKKVAELRKTRPEASEEELQGMVKKTETQNKKVAALRKSHPGASHEELLGMVRKAERAAKKRLSEEEEGDKCVVAAKRACASY